MRIMRWKWAYIGLSVLVLFFSALGLALHGLRLSVDFKGGSLLEFRFPAETDVPGKDAFQSELGESWHLATAQQSDEQSVIIKGDTLEQTQQVEVFARLNKAYPGIELLRAESVGAIISRELLIKTVTALFLVTAFIMLYIWRQFSELRFGVSAVLAMLHDSLVLLGAFSWLGYFANVEVDVLFVTALLTTLSFSVHDTIVVFDRIRELRNKNRTVVFETVVEGAVLETLSRSINNSITIIVMLTALSLLGGETIRWFAVALLIGAVTGTYSSTFTAVPLLLLWQNLRFRLPKFARKRK
ncbi:protein translocase subunit SecF [Candidatus Woesebacteria bacterium]|nr:protein translocase subunit SecF [Candidatus Woesebacteria bacterium]